MEKLKIYENLQRFKKIQDDKVNSDPIYRVLHQTFQRKMAEKHKILALICTDGTCFVQGSIAKIMDDFIASGKDLSPSSICLDYSTVFRSIRKTGNKKRRIEKEVEFA
jgi:hypothetical protein